MKNILGMLLLVTSVAGFVLFWDSPPEQFLKKAATVTEDSLKADGYMRNNLTRSFDREGSLEHQIKATETRFFENGARYELDQPEIESLNQDKEKLYLTANNGIVTQGGERLLLRGNVHAWKPGKTGSYEIRTSSLSYYPGKKYAETDAKVRFTSPRGHTNARGVRAYFEEDRFELLNQVESYYVP